MGTFIITVYIIGCIVSLITNWSILKSLNKEYEDTAAGRTYITGYYLRGVYCTPSQNTLDRIANEIKDARLTAFLFWAWPVILMIILFMIVVDPFTSSSDIIQKHREAKDERIRNEVRAELKAKDEALMSDLDKYIHNRG